MEDRNLRDIVHNGASGEAAPAKCFIEVDFGVFLFSFCIEPIEMSPVTVSQFRMVNLSIISDSFWGI